MTTPTSRLNKVDTGQIEDRNEEIDTQMEQKQKEWEKMIQNQRSSFLLNKHHHQQNVGKYNSQGKNEKNNKLNQDIMAISNEHEVDSQNDKTYEESKYLRIETVFDRDEEVSNQEYAGGLLSMVEQLLKAWTKEKVIDDAYDCDNQLIQQNYDEYGEWATEPKVVK